MFTQKHNSIRIFPKGLKKLTPQRLRQFTFKAYKLEDKDINIQPPISKQIRCVTPDSLLKLNNMFRDNSKSKISNATPKIRINSKSILPTEGSSDIKSKKEKFVPIEKQVNNFDFVGKSKSSSILGKPKDFEKKVTVYEDYSMEYFEDNNISNQLRYSHYRDYHFNSYREKKISYKNTFLAKANSVKASLSRIKKLCMESKNSKTSVRGVAMDNFLKKTAYDKPAYTYGEKLFRLSQASIF